jgi:hypothetical protein
MELKRRHKENYVIKATFKFSKLSSA